MKLIKPSILVPLSFALSLPWFVIGCGDDTQTAAATASPPAASLNLSCSLAGSPSQPGSMPFEQQTSCVPPDGSSADPVPTQKVTFASNSVGNYEVRYDCDRRLVYVRTQGLDPQEATFAMDSDDTFQGDLNYLDKLADDGKGNTQCWAGVNLHLQGQGNCGNAQPGTVGTGTGTGTQTSTPAPGTVAVQGTVDFRQITQDDLDRAGLPSGSQPGILATGTATGTSTGTGTEVSPSPTPTASPNTARVCRLQNACPADGKTSLSCPAPAPTPTATPTETPTPSPSESPTPSPTRTASPTPSPSPSSSPTV